MQAIGTEDVLSIPPDDVSRFIKHQIKRRAMSGLVRRLNSELLDGDAMQRDRATAALRHLGMHDQIRP